MAYWRNSLESKSLWFGLFSHTRLQQCNRSKKYTRARKRSSVFHSALYWPSGFFYWQHLILHQLVQRKCLQGPALASESKAGWILELTVNTLIIGTDGLSEAQMKEGRNSFSIVLYYLVRSPAAWKSRERPRAIALVARSFSLCWFLSFSFLLDNQEVAGTVHLLCKWCRHQHQRQAGSMHSEVSHPGRLLGAWMLLESILGFRSVPNCPTVMSVNELLLKPLPSMLPAVSELCM